MQTDGSGEDEFSRLIMNSLARKTSPRTWGGDAGSETDIFLEKPSDDDLEEESVVFLQDEESVTEDDEDSDTESDVSEDESVLLSPPKLRSPSKTKSKSKSRSTSRSTHVLTVRSDPAFAQQFAHNLIAAKVQLDKCQGLLDSGIFKDDEKLVKALKADTHDAQREMKRLNKQLQGMPKYERASIGVALKMQALDNMVLSLERDGLNPTHGRTHDALAARKQELKALFTSMCSNN